MATEQRGPNITEVLPKRTVRVDPEGSLCTSRLVLRPLRATDRPEFLRVIALARDVLDVWLPLHEPDEDDGALFDRQLRLTTEGDLHGTAFRRAGFLADGRLAGCFNLTRISRGLAFEADINWWVCPEATGQGLATEGAQALVDHALRDLPAGLGPHRVTAGILPGNIASQRLARRLGFRQLEGVRVSLSAGGAWANHEMWVAEPKLEVEEPAESAA